jgi:hypothetical protein
MKLVTAIGAALALLSVAVLGTGYLLVRGTASAATSALEWARPLIESALPPELAPGRIAEPLDRAIALARDGRLDPAALRETLIWLPAALLDGQLDAGEITALGARLERMIRPAPADAGAHPGDAQS